MRSGSLLVCALVVVAAGCGSSFSDGLNEAESDVGDARVLTTEIPSDWLEVRDFAASHGFMFSVPPNWPDVTDVMAPVSQEEYGTTVLAAYSTPGFTTVFVVVEGLAVDADRLDELVAGFDSDPDALSSELDMNVVDVEEVAADGQRGLLLHSDETDMVGSVLAIRRSDGKALGFTIMTDYPDSLSSYENDLLGSVRWADQ